MKNIVKKSITISLSILLTLQPIIINNSNNYPIIAEAHGGRTDSNEGHKDSKNKSGLGSYHYHCNESPAHLHNGGACPYNSSINYSNSSSYENSTVSNIISSSSYTLSIYGKSLELSDGDRVTLSNDLIKIVQDVLNQKRYNCGKADGIIGTKTKEAIEKFLEDNKNNSNTDYLIILMIAESLDL